MASGIVVMNFNIIKRPVLSESQQGHHADEVHQTIQQREVQEVMPLRRVKHADHTDQQHRFCAEHI